MFTAREFPHYSMLRERKKNCYTGEVRKNHCLIELRSNKSAEETPETAIQFFATLPALNPSLWQKLRRDEHLSFELTVQESLIRFAVFLPVRLLEYVKGSLTASYPELVIEEQQKDPLEEFARHLHVQVATLQLKKQNYLPLKTFRDFQNIDPLATLLSTLGKAERNDLIALQLLVLPNAQTSWQNALSAETLATHPQKALIEKKINQSSLKVAYKIAVASESTQRCQDFLKRIGAAYQGLTESEGNALQLKRVWLAKQSFLTSMLERSSKRASTFVLSLDEIATLYHLPNAQLANIQNISWGKHLLGEAPETLPFVTQDTNDTVKKEINVFAQTTYKNHPVKYGLWRADRRRHMYVIGKTGTGKSTMLANMAINDLKHDEGLCVIDPHGDLVETLLNYIPKSRINDVIYFDPADAERTVQINLFEGENVAHRELIASGIISVFHKLYAYSWGPRLEYTLRNALLTLLKIPDAKLSDILDLLTDEKFRAKILSKLDDPILMNYWVNEFNKMQDRQRQESIASILNKVGQFVSSPIIRNVVNTSHSSFSIEELMQKGKILLVNLSQGRLGEDNATLLGAMMITKIQLAAMSRVNQPEEERRDFYLYVDEFQNFATESFNKILSEARKYRLNLILANQYIDQIPEEVRSAIFGNCGNIVSFIMGAGDAEYFYKEFGEKYSKEDLVSLDRYQVINKITINNVMSHPFPAYTLPLAQSSNLNRDKVLRVSRERYARKRDL